MFLRVGADTLLRVTNFLSANNPQLTAGLKKEVLDAIKQVQETGDINKIAKLQIQIERLEDIGIENSKSALDELVSKAPKTAFVKTENANIAIDKIAVGTIIQVKAGEMIPLDGKIISGETTVDEAAITGEPIPKDKHTGDNLFAGTLNKNGFIEIETTKLSVDTTFSKIILS